MNRIASFLWLALCCMLLGKYALYMIGAGVVLFVIGVLIKNKYDDYKFEKHRKERGL